CVCFCCQKRIIVAGCSGIGIENVSIRVILINTSHNQISVGAFAEVLYLSSVPWKISGSQGYDGIKTVAKSLGLIAEQYRGVVRTCRSVPPCHLHIDEGGPLSRSRGNISVRHSQSVRAAAFSQVNPVRVCIKILECMQGEPDLFSSGYISCAFEVRNG